MVWCRGTYAHLFKAVNKLEVKDEAKKKNRSQQMQIEIYKKISFE